MALENEVLEKVGFLGSLHSVAEKWNESETRQERSGLYNAYFSMMVGADQKTKERINPFNQEEDPERLLDDLMHTDADGIYRHIEGTRKAYTKMFAKEYAASKAGLMAIVKERLNAAMAGKSKAEAIEAIKPVLASILKKPKVSNAEAASMERGQIMQMYGPTRYSVGEGAGDRAKDLMMRNIIGKNFVQEGKSKGKETYTVNEKALSNVMNDVVAGCALYIAATAEKEE